MARSSATRGRRDMTTSGDEAFGAASSLVTPPLDGDPPHREQESSTLPSTFRPMERVARRRNGPRSELSCRSHETISAIIWFLGKRTVNGHLSDAWHDHDETVVSAPPRRGGALFGAPSARGVFVSSPRILVLRD